MPSNSIDALDLLVLGRLVVLLLGRLRAAAATGGLVGRLVVAAIVVVVAAVARAGAAAAAPAPAAGRRLLVVVATAGVAALGAGEVVAGLLGEDRVDQIVLAKTAEAVDAELVGEQVEIGKRGLRERGAIKYG